MVMLPVPFGGRGWSRNSRLKCVTIRTDWGRIGINDAIDQACGFIDATAHAAPAGTDHE